MRIQIKPLTVETDSGPVVCSEAEVSVAVSSSVAMRVVPVDSAGNLYADATIGIVGDGSQPDIASFLGSVASASSVLVEGRGF